MTRYPRYLRSHDDAAAAAAADRLCLSLRMNSRAARLASSHSQPLANLQDRGSSLVSHSACRPIRKKAVCQWHVVLEVGTCYPTFAYLIRLI